MARLTSPEIFSCLAENFRLAAEHCRQLAWHPRRGYVLMMFSQEMQLIEGAARQAAAHREDARWLRIAWEIAEAEKRAGAWVRASIKKDDRALAHPLFQKLAENLEGYQRESERLRDAATGRTGTILPVVREGPHRQNRPVAVVLPSGLIVPSS